VAIDDWSAELPTVDGYYWVVERAFPNEPTVECVFVSPDGPVMWDDHIREWRDLADMWGDKGARWYGPLKQPELPEEYRDL
jgi:hypothetical protein